MLRIESLKKCLILKASKITGIKYYNASEIKNNNKLYNMHKKWVIYILVLSISLYFKNKWTISSE